MSFKFHPTAHAREAMALAAGLLLAAAYPKFELAALAWIAPGLMLAAALGTAGRAAFRIGYIAGLAHYLASLYWLLFIPVRFAPVVGWLALAAFLALYSATWVWLCWKIFPKAGRDVPPSRTGAARQGRLGLPLEVFLAANWGQRLAWAFSCAALWVALEMVRARLLSGFPWNFLGVSQYRILPLLQMASMTGVYGLSFLVAWFSVALFCAALAMLTRLAGTPRSWAVELSVPLLVLVTVASLGMHQILEAPAAVGRGVPAEPSTSGTLESAAQPEASPHPDTLNVALVQPSIPQTMIWNSTEASNRFQQLLQLSERALAAKPDLLVWPEAAVPNLFRYDTNIHRAVTNFVRAHRVWLVLGADDAEGHPGARDESEVDYYNSSFLITPEGEVAATYRKQRLVIFGEYVPLGRWLPFLKDFTGVQGDFTPGKGPVTFNLPKLHVKTSVLICFEDVFPHLTRAYVEDDTDFLLNLTNNGWFGESAAQWQHAANAVFRAVENGLPLVRAANNGLTCWVDAQGRLREIYFAGTQDIYGAGFEIVHVPVLTGQTREPTFYRRHGDWFGWGCVGLGAIVVVVHSARERRGGRSTRITTPRLVGSRLKAV